MLKLRDVKINYGQIRAVKGVSLEVLEGEVVVIIGANGAGKSTLLMGISGLAPCEGEIWYWDLRIDRMKGHRIVKLGISHVPEGRRLFPKMTVLENLKIGSYLRTNKTEINKDLEKIFETYPILKKRRRQLAGTLSGGEQQMLTLGRGLMSNPKLLLMDEPSLGLAPLIVKEIEQYIQDIKTKGMTIVLVEQNAHMALKLADRGYVLETGRIALSGIAKDLLSNQHVQKAYLGG